MGNTVNDHNVLGSANFEPEVNRRKSPVKVFAASFVLLCAAAFLFAQESGIRAACSKAEMDCIVGAVRAVLRGETYFESQQYTEDAGESGSPLSRLNRE